MFAVHKHLMCASLMILVATNVGLSQQPLEDLLAASFRITDGDHSGTCFLVAARRADPVPVRQVVLATAAHVLEQMTGPKCDLILRTPTADGGFARKVFPLEIRDQDRPRWSRHPDVDVAAMLVTLPEDVAAHVIPIDDVADEVPLVNRTVRVGREVWITCFPAKLEANDAGWPILRRGTIATHPLAPLKTAKTMMLDYSVFGGDSGAPVATLVDGRPLIVGIASGMQRQTDRSSLPFEERTMHTSLGLSVAVQAVYLRETIDLIYAK